MSGVIATVAIAATSLYMQYESGEQAKKASKEQARAQKEASAAQGRISEVETQRARISQAREARIRRAQVLASTSGVGGGTSGISGATSSITSQTASNIGGIGVTQTFAQQATAANQRAADAGAKLAEAQATGQQWGAIGNLASPFLPKAMETIFTKKP